MTVKELVARYFKTHPEYDGLAGDCCGCSKDDLTPCEYMSDRCEFGHLGEDEDGEEVYIPGPRPKRRA